MKGLLIRYAYILITLIPVSIYLMSFCLFEINSESSLKIKTMIVESVSGHQATPALMIIEYKARVLWLSSSLLSITAYLIALTWSVVTVNRCCQKSHLTKMSIIGFAILSLTLLQIGRADSESAMYNSIFDTTYHALKVSTLITHLLLDKIFIIINIVNVLAAVTPVFILIAICSTISTPIEMSAQKPEFFMKRMTYMKQGIMVGSIVLLFGIIHMVAWMQWPAAMLEESELKKAALNAFAAISQYWGITFSLLLICLYAAAAIYWQAQVKAILLITQADIDINKWMEDNGFTVSWQKHVLQLSAMLTPFLAGSFSSGIEMLTMH
ncbi:MAG: hypothetical protein HOO92_08265 [Methylococcaceae bacterium]|nr:hypothetical protein [Methylococcaceae bacterium]